MYLGELLRNNYDIDRVATTLKTLDLFMRLDYLQAESDLDKIVDDNGSSANIGSLLGELESRIIEHLVYIAHEYGITLNEDHNTSLYELYVLIDGVERLTEYEQPIEILDLVDSREDDVDCMVEILSLVVKEMDNGNLLDFYTVISSISENFFRNLLLTVEGTREEIVDFDANPVIKIPEVKGEVWDWISASGRIGYSLEGAFALLEDTLLEVLLERPTNTSVKTTCYELKTLVHYSSNEDKTDTLILTLLERLNETPDVMLWAQGSLPYIELRFDE
jgi:hypothetical protein